MLGLFATSTVTLSLEGWTLRLLETRGHQVLMWANIPLTPSLMRNGVVSDATALGQMIGDAFRTGRLSRRKVICALNEPQAVSRILTVPKTKGVNLAKVVDREVRRLMPTAQEDGYLYWQAMESKAQTQQRVYVLTVRKEPLVALVAALKVAGIRPYRMDLRALALARSINQKDAILANLEVNCVDVVVVVEDVPALMRSIYLGDEPVPLATAQDRLLSELSRTISFYNDTNRSNPLAPTLPIYLAGDLGGDPDLVAPVEEVTGHPVAVVEPPLEYPPEFPPSRYMVNIGLALKEL